MPGTNGVRPIPASARAGFVVNFSQVGNNVVATGNGSLNLAALTKLSTPQNAAPAGLRGNGELLYLGTPNSGPVYTEYNGLVGPSSIGNSLNFILASSSTGSFLAQDSTQLFVPTAYVSGSILSNTTTWNDATISGLGLTPGTYTWTWGTGVTDGLL